MDTDSLSCDHFVASLLDPTANLRRQIRHVRCAGVSVPVRIMDIPEGGAVLGAPLVISFHGVAPKDQPYPFFYGQGFAAGKDGLPRTVLSICDATLEQFPDLRFGWYEGSEGRDVPAALHELIVAVVAALAPKKTILTGGSTGAHAALRHARAVPGALLFMLNPLPRISIYWKPAVEAYFQTCWGGDYDRDSLTNPHVVDDPVDRYAGTELTNTFLIVQNPTDPYFFRQTVPMLEKLSRHPKTAANVMAVMPPMGSSVGHNMPAGLYESWIEATILAPDLQPLSVLQTFQAMEQAGPRRPAAKDHASAVSPLRVAQAQQIVKMLSPGRTAE